MKFGEFKDLPKGCWIYIIIAITIIIVVAISMGFDNFFVLAVIGIVGGVISYLTRP